MIGILSDTKGQVIAFLTSYKCLMSDCMSFFRLTVVMYSPLDLASWTEIWADHGFLGMHQS